MAKTTAQPTPEEALKAKNEGVKKAHLAILSEIKSLLPLYPSEYLRTYIEVDYSNIGFSNQHGFYSPLLHLRFEEHMGVCTIYFAKNFNFKQQVGNFLDNLLPRSIYKYTAAGDTEINIEDTLNFSLFNIDDYREAKNLLDQGFKGCQKVTVKSIEREA